MLDENLNPDERAIVVKLLRDTIAADRFPLSPRVRALKAILAKLDPSAVPAAEPVAPPVRWTNSTIGQRKRRARR